jgi:hypothetical protein
MITVRVTVDDEVIAERTEDGFLLGGQLFIHFGEE